MSMTPFRPIIYRIIYRWLASLPLYKKPQTKLTSKSFLHSWIAKNSSSFPKFNQIDTKMGCLTVFRPVILTDPWRTSSNCTSISLPSVSPNLHTLSTCGCRITTGVRDFGFRRTDHHHHHQLNSYHHENASSSSMENEHEPSQEAILKAISVISKAEGRIGRTTTMVLGGTITNDSTYEGLSLNKMLNIYPTARGFTAIGSGGDDFVQSMVVAVESVVRHPIPQGKVKQKLSSGGKYVSVNIGPVQIVSSKQVQAVYYAMKRDDRMRYFL